MNLGRYEQARVRLEQTIQQARIADMKDLVKEFVF
jgi:hypothetical protein